MGNHCRRRTSSCNGGLRLLSYECCRGTGSRSGHIPALLAGGLRTRLSRAEYRDGLRSRPILPATDANGVPTVSGRNTGGAVAGWKQPASEALSQALQRAFQWLSQRAILSKSRNSSRISGLAKHPRRAEVTVFAPLDSIPRISMQRCLPSITTYVPLGCSFSSR